MDNETAAQFKDWGGSVEDQVDSLHAVVKATVNILEDFSAEKLRLEESQKAVFNILEDFTAEKTGLEDTQRATFNILEDFHVEKVRLGETQRAIFNILEDFYTEKIKVETFNEALTKEIRERQRAEEEVRRLNEELNRHAAQLGAANKELEAFSYSVSHDLRAPLRSVDGFSQVLLEDYADKLDEQGKSYLGRLRAASQRMAQLIDDMLKLARVTRVEMYCKTVNLSGLAQAVAMELHKTEPDRQTEFIITPELMANGDSQLLRVVIENILGNAWKFTSKHPKARVEFGVTDHDGKLLYYVRDDGAGFDMAYVDKLFTPFQRLHAPTEFPGTGIGLATVQRIIHRHGGRVWAEGEVEKGATFYFTLWKTNDFSDREDTITTIEESL